MRIPGRLRDTTLGDVLGAMWREHTTGYLEIIDPAGRCHHIELKEGAIHRVHSPQGPRLGEILQVDPVHTHAVGEDEARGRLGERLLELGILDDSQLSSALRLQNLRRLEYLFSLSDAALRFRVPRPAESDATAPEPLFADDFLRGRPRYRRRAERVAPAAERKAALGSRLRALRVLGLPEDASSDDVRIAFRHLAGKYHPDRHARLDPEERAELFRKFAEISNAFHCLSA